MENGTKILEGHSDLEKGAYLGAIASIATADRTASPEEMEYLSGLCDAAELSVAQKNAVIHAATEEFGEDLTKCLDVLQKSDLKYSLVADLMAFAKSDGDYTEDEQENVDKISQYLGVDKHQASLLDEFSDKASSTNAEPEKISQPAFLSSLGLKEKMQSAGINPTGFLKGLLGIAAPLLLSGMISRGLRRRNSSGGFGGGASSMLGGGGGLTSLIRMLSGGRSMNSAGGLFGRMLGG
jgi:uncharacterized tellurite resistance protein B-like protein